LGPKFSVAKPSLAQCTELSAQIRRNWFRAANGHLYALDRSVFDNLESTESQLDQMGKRQPLRKKQYYWTPSRSIDTLDPDLADSALSETSVMVESSTFEMRLMRSQKVCSGWDPTKKKAQKTSDDTMK